MRPQKLNWFILLAFILIIQPECASGQSQDNPWLYMINKDNRRVSGILKEGYRVKVLVRDGLEFKGKLDFRNDSAIFIGVHRIPVDSIAKINDVSNALARYTIVPLVALFPMLLWPGASLTMFEGKRNFTFGRNHYLTLSPYPPNVVYLTEIDKHRREDSTRNPRMYHYLEPPSNFFYIGTDIEKLIVPAFSFDFDLFFGSNKGLMVQYAYKPANRTGQFAFMNWNSNVDAFCETIKWQFTPVMWFNNRFRFKRYFAGPTVLYKAFSAENVMVSQYTYTGFLEYSTPYWREKKMWGLGFRIGSIPSTRVGLSWSVEVGYRHSDVSDSLIPPPSISNMTYKEHFIENYVTLDATLALKFKIRQHR